MIDRILNRRVVRDTLFSGEIFVHLLIIIGILLLTDHFRTLNNYMDILANP